MFESTNKIPWVIFIFMVTTGFQANHHLISLEGMNPILIAANKKKGFTGYQQKAIMGEC